MCECCSIFLSKCKCDYKGVWLIFFFFNSRTFLSKWMPSCWKWLSWEATCFSVGDVVAQNLLDAFRKPPWVLQRLFHFFQCHPLSVDFLILNSPTSEGYFLVWLRNCLFRPFPEEEFQRMSPTMVAFLELRMCLLWGRNVHLDFTFCHVCFIKRWDL